MLNCNNVETNKPFLVDVPVRISIWTRPECQRAQLEVIRKARPSILFLISDGGRNEKEWEAIYTNRKLYEEGIDWDCTVYKLFEDHNNGLYTMGRKCMEFVWSKVDRCIFLEDDQIPAVSYFRYCAELLEKYKDDPRIEMVCGHNPHVTYEDALPNDYFFTESGWSIWGVATWRRNYTNREYPFDYAEDPYIKRCLKDNLNAFWYEKVDGYCKQQLVDNHVPGDEYYFAINSVLFHRMAIMPTRNMISNVGYMGEHFAFRDGEKLPKYFCAKTYEIDFPIKHPKYVVDDKNYSREYDKLLGHTPVHPVIYFFKRVKNFMRLLSEGKAVAAVKNKLRKTSVEER